MGFKPMLLCLRDRRRSAVLSLRVLTRIAEIRACLVRDRLQLLDDLRLLRGEILRFTGILLNVVQLELVHFLVGSAGEGELPVALADGHERETLVVVERVAR